jgi:hypothetical protein
MSDIHLLGTLIESEDPRAKKFGTLKNINHASITEICNIQGIFYTKAAR